MNARVLMTPPPEITVILPGYNEAENINAMLAQVHAALTSVGRPFEIVYVDDGSTDDSLQTLKRARVEFQNLIVVYHRSNFGQSAAIISGFEAARGELVITMDADLQNDPADLPAMIELLYREQADLVCGIRKNRQDSRMKIFVGRVGNWARRWVLNDSVTDAGCSMRVIRRNALQRLPAFRGLHRFLPTIIAIHGFIIIEMPISHRARGGGASKYGVGNRLWVGLFDLVGLIWYRNRVISMRGLRV